MASPAGRGDPDPSEVAVIGLDEALALVAAAREQAQRCGLAMTIAIAKAITAVGWRQPTSEKARKAAALPGFATAITAMYPGRYAPKMVGCPSIGASSWSRE